MGNPNRRDMFLGMGVAAGLTTLGPGRSAATTDVGSWSAGKVLRRIELSGKAEVEFLARLGRAASTPTALPEGGSGRLTRSVEGRVVVKTDPEGKPFAFGLAFTCDPRVVNRLSVERQPLIARRFCFSTGPICWSPGHGLPVYDAYCPRYEYGAGAYYRDAKWHQIVPILGGQGYFTGCQGSDVCAAPEPGPVCFDVNDSHHDDNAGYYVITIWSWS